MKPFLKYAGNKYAQLEHILKILPPGGRLIEPFLGAGAVFLNTNYDSYVLNDLNKDVMAVWAQLKLRPAHFIKQCQGMFQNGENTPEAYYRHRQDFNKTRSPKLFVYLNKHCFNGLCRYNSSGNFNAPFGKYKEPYFAFEEMMSAAFKLQNVTLHNTDFQEHFEVAGQGDVIFADPPYVPLSQTSNFTSYSAGGFDWDDQVRLVEQARSAHLRGAKVLICNHDTPDTRLLYQDAEIYSYSVRRSISCNGDKRGKAPELMAVYQ